MGLFGTAFCILFLLTVIQGIVTNLYCAPDFCQFCFKTARFLSTAVITLGYYDLVIIAVLYVYLIKYCICLGLRTHRIYHGMTKDIAEVVQGTTRGRYKRNTCLRYKVDKATAEFLEKWLVAKMELIWREIKMNHSKRKLTPHHLHTKSRNPWKRVTW